MTPQELADTEDRAIRAAQTADYLRAGARGVSLAPVPAWTPAPLLGRLAARGVSLVVADGTIHARPAALLTAADRAELRARHAELVAALNDAETFAA
jgi:hypothetical protein